MSCLLLVACGITHAQVKFSVSAPKSIGVNQQFELTYTVENGSFDKIQLPSLDDFKVLGKNGPSDRFSFNGTQMTHQFSYAFILQPKKEGTFTIGKASINIEGAKMESNELTITVTGPVKQQAQRPRDPYGFDDDDPFAQIQQMQQQMQQRMQQMMGGAQQVPSNPANEKTLKDNCFVRLVPDKSAAYLGEKVSATLKLYFNPDFQIAQYGIPKAPSYDGFWSQEVTMPKEPQVRTETLNGKKFNVVDLQITNLYPQKGGSLKVSPFDVEMVVLAPVRSGWGVQYGQFKLKSTTNEVGILIKDLPTAGKPADFNGAVGKFTYSAKLSVTEGKTDNALTYSIKISGAGNLKTIDLPKPELPDGFEVFDPKVKDDVTSSAAGMSGSKQYDYLIIPRQPGDYKIPASSFSYFDPSAGKYFTLSSPEMPLRVTGAPSQNPNSNSDAFASKEDVSALHSDIRFIKTRPGELERSGTPFFGSAAYTGLLASPLLLFIGLIFVKRKNEDLAADIVGAMRRRATKLAKKRLSVADKHLSKNNKTAFYDEVSRALWGYLGDKLNIDQAQLSKDNVEEKLMSRNVKTETVTKLKNLISVCEQALYAPIGGGDEMKQNYNTAVALITDLEDEIK